MKIGKWKTCYFQSVFRCILFFFVHWVLRGLVVGMLPSGQAGGVLGGTRDESGLL